MRIHEQTLNDYRYAFFLDLNKHKTISVTVTIQAPSQEEANKIVNANKLLEFAEYVARQQAINWGYPVRRQTPQVVMDQYHQDIETAAMRLAKAEEQVRHFEKTQGLQSQATREAWVERGSARLALSLATNALVHVRDQQHRDPFLDQ